MREAGGTLVLSATDLSNFLSCRHRTALEMAAARGKRKRPHFHDPLLEILFKRGLDHEKRYIQSLESAGRSILDLVDVKDPDAAVAQTLAAMRAGADVLVQAALRGKRWYGRPDVLLRVDASSASQPL